VTNLGKWRLRRASSSDLGLRSSPFYPADCGKASAGEAQVNGQLLIVIGRQLTLRVNGAQHGCGLLVIGDAEWLRVIG
jgi:hypothetical protein